MSGSGDQALDAMIARLRSLEGMPRDVAEEIAPLLLEDVRKTAAAGTTYDGEPWAPTKSGGRPLVNAAAHLSSRVLGTVAQVVLKGIDVVHNRGTKRIPTRRILPDAGAGMPPRATAIARDAAARAFARILSGGGS